MEGACTDEWNHMDRKALVGLLSGVSLVIATLIAVAVLNMPEAANAAKSDEVVTCSASHGALDRSYGVGANDPRCTPLAQ